MGKPWVSGACGPDAFDCWGLLRFVYLARRGVELCPYAGVEQSGLAGMLKNAQSEIAAHWQPISEPCHFVAVGMSRGRRVEHVGLWLDTDGGGIFHARQGSGVLFQSIPSVRASGIQNFTFYRLR